jgi:hypothetical protein
MAAVYPAGPDPMIKTLLCVLFGVVLIMGFLLPVFVL